MLNLPLPDKAGRGALEQRIQAIVRDMSKAGNGKDPHEFERLAYRLDQERKRFHALYGVKEHPAEAPLHSESANG